MNAALESLRELVDAGIKNGFAKKRPTWAPPLTLGDELASVLREIGWLTPEDRDVGRLWARFTDPSRGPIRCYGFELRCGTKRSGKLIYECACWRPGEEWASGPQWIASTRPESTWNRKLPFALRAVELGAVRVTEFAGSPGEQMTIGGVIAGICACCGRTLTDPISIERGIGPECYSGSSEFRKVARRLGGAQ